MKNSRDNSRVVPVNMTVELEGPGRPVTIQQLFFLGGGGGVGYNSEAIRNTTLFTVPRFSGQERRGTLHRLNQWQIQTFR